MLFRSKESELFWVIAWPGTVVHEALHYIIGMILLARPSRFSVLPEAKDNIGQTVGYVDFDNIQWYNALPTGLAPLLGIFVALFLAGSMTNEFSLGNAVLCWLTASILSQSIPSSQDFKVAFHSLFGVAVYGTALAGFILL
mgnify:FL=1